MVMTIQTFSSEVISCTIHSHSLPLYYRAPQASKTAVFLVSELRLELAVKPGVTVDKVVAAGAEGVVVTRDIRCGRTSTVFSARKDTRTAGYCTLHLQCTTSTTAGSNGRHWTEIFVYCTSDSSHLITSIFFRHHIANVHFDGDCLTLFWFDGLTYSSSRKYAESILHQTFLFDCVMCDARLIECPIE